MEIARPVGASVVLGALIAVTALGIAGTWADLSSAEAELQVKAEFVSGNVRAIRTDAASSTPGAPARLFIEADTETLAAAQLDGLVRSTAAEAGGSVLSSRADAKHDEGGIAGRIEVVAEVEAQNDVLQSILLRLETGAPYLGVESLAIQPVQSNGGAPEEAVKLRADITVVGYWDSVKR